MHTTLWDIIIMGIFYSATPRGIFPLLGVTKLHIHLKTSQYFLIFTLSP